MWKTVLGSMLLIAYACVYAQTRSNPSGGHQRSALSRVKAEDNETFKPGMKIDFYCLVASVEHPRAGVMVTCKRPVGVYFMSWWTDYDAFAKAASKLTHDEIVHARCNVQQVMPDQIDLACEPPVKAGP